jgi:hypothetical protein
MQLAARCPGKRAAKQVHRRIFRTIASEQRALFRAVHDAADVGPVDSAGAHCARLEGRDQRATPQVFAVVFGGGAAGEFRLGVAGRVDVALAHQDRAAACGGRGGEE